MELKLTAARKPKEGNRTSQRRDKLIVQIDQQIERLKDPETLPAKQSSWFWQQDDGTYLLSIKYGRADIELSKGMYSISCADRSEVLSALEQVRTMTTNGDLDQPLQNASDALRAKFKKKKS